MKKPQEKFEGLVNSVGRILPGLWHPNYPWNGSADATLSNDETGVMIVFRMNDRKVWGYFFITIAKPRSPAHSTPSYSLDARRISPLQVCESIRSALEY